MVDYLWSRFARIRFIRARTDLVSSLISSVLSKIPTHARPTSDGTTLPFLPNPFGSRENLIHPVQSPLHMPKRIAQWIQDAKH